MDFNEQVALLKNKIELVKSNKYMANHEKYVEVNAYFANIVCAIASFCPDVSLKEIQSVTDVLNDFNDEYYNGNLNN